MKLFLALLLSPVLEEAVSHLHGSLEGIHWQTPHPLTLHLHSLNTVTDPALMDELDLQLTRLRWLSFPLAVQEVFFHQHNNRYNLTAGLSPSEPLTRLHARLGTLLHRLGLSPSPMRFRPALPLGNTTQPMTEALQRWTQRHNLFHSQEAPVDTLCLMEQVSPHPGDSGVMLETYHATDHPSDDGRIVF